MSAFCNRNNRMRTPFLLAAIGLAAVLTACGDHANPTADAGAEMLPTTLSGTVRLNSGMALSGAAPRATQMVATASTWTANAAASGQTMDFPAEPTLAPA